MKLQTSVILSLASLTLLAIVSSVTGGDDFGERFEWTPEVPGFSFIGEETFFCGGESRRVKIYSHRSTGLEFVLVPGGTFKMGSPSWDGESDEFPSHPVTVKPFLLCRTECTQDAWDRIGGDDNRSFEGGSLPIEGVSWKACADWCHRAGLRLPTEAEWEYSCRAGTRSKYSFGNTDEDLDPYAWHRDNSNGSPHAVGQKRPNALGLHDMHGNVWELCSDRAHENYRNAPADGSSWESGTNTKRVKRGGSFLSHDPEYCRSANRGQGSFDRGSNYAGFRPALSIDSGDMKPYPAKLDVHIERGQDVSDERR